MPLTEKEIHELLVKQNGNCHYPKSIHCPECPYRGLDSELRCYSGEDHRMIKSTAWLKQHNNEIEIKKSMTLILTKREFFAAMAMQGILSSQKYGNPKEFSKVSVVFSDALIDELNKPKE